MILETLKIVEGIQNINKLKMLTYTSMYLARQDDRMWNYYFTCQSME